jgi:CRP-like cAMP-binding protein
MVNMLQFAGDAPEVTFAAGDHVIREKKPLTSLFILKNGEVEIRREGSPVCRISRQGSVFGEVSALLGTDSTAAVVATKPSTLVEIPDAVSFFAANHAATLEIARLLAHRLNWTTINYVREMDDEDSLFRPGRG